MRSLGRRWAYRFIAISEWPRSAGLPTSFLPRLRWGQKPLLGGTRKASLHVADMERRASHSIRTISIKERLAWLGHEFPALRILPVPRQYFIDIMQVRTQRLELS